MGLTRKDLFATVFTALAVLTFAAAHQGWNVWLVGGSHRWAAGVVTVLGIAACAQGTPGRDAASRALATLGMASGVFAVVALITGSLTPLSLLVLATVALWALSLTLHAHRGQLTSGAR